MADMTMGGGAAPETVANTPQVPEIHAPASTEPTSSETGDGQGEGGQPPEPKAPWEENRNGDWDGVPKGARVRIQKQSRRIDEMQGIIDEQKRMFDALVGHVKAAQPALKREDFENEDDYLDYRLEQREAAKAAARQQAEAEKAAKLAPVEQVRQEWMGKVQAAKAEGLADYDQVLADAGLRLRDHELQAVARSEFGPHIMYVLAKNPGLVLSLEDMAPQERMHALGRIEADVRAWKQQAKAAQTAPAPANAPAAQGAPAPAAAQQKPAVPPPPPKAPAGSGGGSRSNDWIGDRNAKFGIY